MVAVSTDSVHSHKAWADVARNKGGIQGIKTPVAGDFTKTISRDYGVLFEANGAALRGTFIINPEGTVVHASVNFFPVGRSVSEVLRTIEAFQEAGKGVVCPIDWAKGKDTINPKEASKYFEKVK